MGTKLHRCRAYGCRKMIPVSESHCNEHLEQKRNRETDKSYDQWRKTNRKAGKRNNFYKQSAWKNHKQPEIMARDHRLCKYCDLVGCVTPADLVDHVVPREIAPELELEDEYLVASCKACHNLKTVWEQSYYGTGQYNKLNKDAVKILDYKLLKFIFENPK